MYGAQITKVGFKNIGVIDDYKYKFNFLCEEVSLFLIICLLTNLEAKLSLDDNIGIWLLDEGKGDVAKDSSPNKYEGELKGRQMG